MPTFDQEQRKAGVHPSPASWLTRGAWWQPRWFILDNGILSYHKCKEDANNGCKGSIRMAACDIIVHPTVMTRLDLVIPGEQHYYLQASTPQERQSWLIALGSSKAALGENGGSDKCEDASPDVMRNKQSELRLYCDLLMQQVHSVKQMASAPSSPDEKLDFEKLTESTSLIVATCDTFIATLDDCMKLASSLCVFESPPHHNNSELAVMAAPPWTKQGTRVLTRPGERQSHVSSYALGIHTSSSQHKVHDSFSSKHSPARSSSSHDCKSDAFPLAFLGKLQSRPSNKEMNGAPSGNYYANLQQSINGSLSNGMQNDISPVKLSASISPEDSDDLMSFTEAGDKSVKTFFSVMPTSFANVDTSVEDHIHVAPFLEACKNLVPIFDKLNTSALAPVKMDFCGNIRKIQQKLDNCCPEQPVTLQSMVLNEVANNQHQHSDSATSALLWLKRSLEFIAEFLKECLTDCTDMGLCASNAYSRTLKLYHGWVVRGIFAVAVKALPYREGFISHLGADGSPKSDTSSQSFQDALLKDIEFFVLHLDRVLQEINSFYLRHSLDSPTSV